jgi:hypothetical protein
MSSLVFSAVGLLLAAGAIGLLTYKAVNAEPLCAAEAPGMLCAAQYLAVLAVLTLWLSARLCGSATMANMLTAAADVALIAVVVTMVNTDAAALVDVSNPQRMLGNALVVVVALWRVSARVSQLLPAPQSAYGYPGQYDVPVQPYWQPYGQPYQV